MAHLSLVGSSVHKEFKSEFERAFNNDWSSVGACSIISTIVWKWPFFVSHNCYITSITIRTILVFHL